MDEVLNLQEIFPGFRTVFVGCLILAFLGIFLDRFFWRRKLSGWRSELGQVWSKFHSSKKSINIKDLNQVYLGFFETVYGTRIFSWHRLVASMVSTMIALFSISFLFGFENTPWAEFFGDMTLDGEIEWFTFILAGFLVTFFNFIPDYFSLAETRFILRLAKKFSAFAVPFLILVDLALTTAIFIFGIVFGYALIFSSEFSIFGETEVWGFVVSVLLFFINPEFWSGFWQALVDLFTRGEIFDNDLTDFLFEPVEGALIFYLTTFVTSLFGSCLSRPTLEPGLSPGFLIGGLISSGTSLPQKARLRLRRLC